MLENINKIEDAMRHLRNWTKKKRDSELLSLIIKFQMRKQMLDEKTNPKNKVPQISLLNDYTQPCQFIEDAWA